MKTLEPLTVIQRGPSDLWGSWKGFCSKPYLPPPSAAQPGSGLGPAGSTRRRLATESGLSGLEIGSLAKAPRLLSLFGSRDEATSTAPETRRRGCGPWGRRRR